MGYLLTAIVIGLIAYRIGYEVAHVAIAKECRRLGGFYYGDMVFKVSAIDGPPPRERVVRPRPRGDGYSPDVPTPAGPIYPPGDE